jgi:uroporphyrinogen-III synthase
MIAPVLKGKGVLITRAKEQASSLSRLIEKAGGVPIEVPLLSFIKTMDVYEEVGASIQSYEWIVFTSANAVRFFFNTWPRQELKKLPSIAAVGSSTQRELSRYGISVDLMPNEYVAESLVETMVKRLKPCRVLFPKGNLARPTVKVGLEANGFIVDEMTVYETKRPLEAKVMLCEAFQKHRIEIITFTSPSAVDHFVTLLDREFILHEHLLYAYIGPIAAARAKQRGLPIHIVAKTYTGKGLVNAICDFVKEDG